MSEDVKQLPLEGFSRWKTIKPLVNISKEKFRQMQRAHRAPQPMRLSMRVTVYSNAELHKWFKDPTNYRAEV